MSSHPRHKVRRVAQRGHYDAPTIHAILDAGWVAHVSFADPGGQPFVIPMLYAREGESIYLHGSIASRLMKTVGEGIATCLCVTHVDGLVLARSHFHHSMNYRSVVAFGKAEPVPGQRSPSPRNRAERSTPSIGCDSGSSAPASAANVG